MVGYRTVADLYPDVCIVLPSISVQLYVPVLAPNIIFYSAKLKFVVLSGSPVGMGLRPDALGIVAFIFDQYGILVTKMPWARYVVIFRP